MTQPNSNTCDEILLDRYLDGDLDAGEMAQMEAHITGCRNAVARWPPYGLFTGSSRPGSTRRRIQWDFVALEKQVLNKKPFGNIVRGVVFPGLSLP